jgi:glycosyltransferase involved in cell wall biosynthesis
MSLAERQSVSASGVPIGIWVSSFSAGGTERQMVHLMRELDPSLFTVHALCFAARGPWLDAARERSASLVEFYFQDFRRPDTWKQIGWYSRWCRKHGIAAIIASDFYTNVFGLAGAALAGVPVRIGGRREINTDKSRAKLALQRAAYGLAHRVVANSRAAADTLRREHVGEDTIRVVPNGVEIPEAVAREPRPLRRAITIANLRAEKGHDVLIDALAIRPDLGAIQLDFAGDGPCRSALEQRARDRGVADRVHFLGERHDIQSLLRTADFSILPSRTEAFPNSVLEAMAAGLPVIASRTGGICELIEPDVTGLLVTPGDPADLSRAIARIAADPDAALRLGAAARRSVVDRYTIRNMVNGFTDILLTELDARDARRARAPLPNHS